MAPSWILSQAENLASSNLQDEATKGYYFPKKPATNFGPQLFVVPQQAEKVASSSLQCQSYSTGISESDPPCKACFYLVFRGFPIYRSES